MNTLDRRRTLYWAPAGGLAPALICHPFPAMRVPALHQFEPRFRHTLRDVLDFRPPLACVGGNFPSRALASF
eukprot:CAMPEP_0172631594 /NCGR_PEP_ID=MMETSP1068-20121228/180033_1 /TAXON_ID=35684 /ORGANISM="Pseudopedinella elastica, Strain CCMP716" /LENGTH=71 /DNA_ID=CAMNT_0013442779 /DNA_START=106 /DNA_END=318 /DNA_ORIENTATION=+